MTTFIKSINYYSYYTEILKCALAWHSTHYSQLMSQTPVKNQIITAFAFKHIWTWSPHCSQRSCNTNTFTKKFKQCSSYFHTVDLMYVRLHGFAEPQVVRVLRRREEKRISGGRGQEVLLVVRVIEGGAWGAW